MNRQGPRIVINTKCELLVSEESDLKDPGYVYLEFLVSDSVSSIATLVISEAPSLYRYYFNNDGLYMYYRLKVPTKTMLGEENIETRLYFDDSTNKLMIGNLEVTRSKQLEDVVDDDSPSATYGISSDIIEEPVFSICRISTCLENLQRKYIFEGTPKKVCKTESNKLFRDFLFASIFILRLLIRQQRYEEALRILDHVNSCDGMCELVNRFNKNSCGCK